MKAIDFSRLFQRQVRMLRGMKYRFDSLNVSRTNDQQVLESSRSQASQRFADNQLALVARHAEAWRSAITQWDEQLEKQIATAERTTLECLHYEKAKSRALKKEFNENKAKTKSEFETATSELKRKLDETLRGIGQSRDSTFEKLESQRRGIEQQVNECREWIGMRTGNLSLQSLQSTLSTDVAKEVSGMNELQQIAKELEATKKALAVEMGRLKSHPLANRLGGILFVVTGLVVGLIAAGLTFLANLAPLVIALVGLFALVITASIMYLAAAPMISRTMKRLLPAVVDQESRANLILSQGRRIAEGNYQIEFSRHTQSHASQQLRLDAEYRDKRMQLVETYNAESAKLVSNCRNQRLSSAKIRVENQDSIHRTTKPRIDELKNQQVIEQQQLTVQSERFLSELEREFTHTQKHVVDRWLEGSKQSADRMQAVEQAGLDRLPFWNAECFLQGDWPRHNDCLAWRIGHVDPQERYSQTLSELRLPSETKSKSWPVFFDVSSQGTLILFADPECKNDSDAIVRNVLLRAETSLNAGMLHATIIDPEGLGKQFSWLMSLADIDPVLVGHRVWTQPLQIAEQLAILARHVEDTIQQSLRDRFANLIAYNREAGPMAVPYHLIVWSNFPLGLDEYSWQSLCSIMSSGGKCGVGVILQVSESYVAPAYLDRSKLDEFGLRLRISGQSASRNDADSKINIRDDQAAKGATIRIAHPDLQRFPLKPELPPGEDRVQRIIEHHLESLSSLGRRIVPFESIVSSEPGLHVANSYDGLSIPVGVSDSGRVQNLKLGMGTAQHVLIAGKTGSGKSSLLHTMITSAAIKYSPEHLRLVLLDFKKGVEFQVYAEAALSHADVIGIESKREFGVSVLEYLDRIMNARGEAFRQWGIQDLPSLAKKYPQHTLPRILVLIDEFQELFVEDDKLTQQASMLMDRIVRQGRSFGVHLVLASQTLGGAYSLPRTTLSQMAVRIALHCDSSDAMLILSEDNTAAERLRHSGQAIYNDGGGRFESNQSFQVAYIEKSDQLHRLRALRKFDVPRSPTTNPLGRQIVFEGHKPAVWDAHQISLAMSTMQLDHGSLPVFLGESVSIDPPMVKTLTQNAGRNIMVVGQDESMAASLLAGAVAGFGFVSKTESELLQVIVLDGTRNEDVETKRCISALALSNVRTQMADVRSVDSVMQTIQDELNRRSEQSEADHPPMLIAIANLSRFRELRRAEEFAFSDSSENVVRPETILANLLRDGPALGMYVWIWADSASSITRWLSRQSMRDLELRILMQMSTSDSNQLIDTNAANRLERYVVLIHDDVEGKAIKFRPFELQSVLAAIA
ncbi:MAG: FtsK/SpoIIIE domain-containing protein [Pirellula sp.]